MTAKLQPWTASFARQPIPELEQVEHSSACWVGSVSTTDTLAFSEFLFHAKRGDLENLVRFQHIGGDLAYAVILRIRDDQWRLLVIISPEDPLQNESCIQSSTVHPKIDVAENRENLVEIETRLKQDCNIRFSDIIKEWLRF